MQKYFFASEAVSEGHPDKICDQIGDALLDECLRRNEEARTAFELMVTKNNLFIAGEKNFCQLDDSEMEEIIRNKIRKIGYEQEDFHWKTVKIHNEINLQSSEISSCVKKKDEKILGAGDQAVVFGYATDTKQFMPLPFFYANKIHEKMKILRKNGTLPFLLPDAKSMVVFEYEKEGEIGIPKKVKSITYSSHHTRDISVEDLRNILKKYILEIFEPEYISKETNLLINPGGSFYQGGPGSDTGLSGRKIIVDTYGGFAPHGGGAFSGKDATKPDRSAAYIARYIAKNVVAGGYARKCTVQLSYNIGLSNPCSININLHNDEKRKISSYELERIISKKMDLSISGIIKFLELKKPIFEKTSVGGHFGRNPEEDGSFSWEKIDLW